jgi:uncharacterized protein (DUF1778 family)
LATLTRMGRPPLSDEERRDKPLRIRLTDEERELIDEAAENAGEPSSAWARDLLVREAARLAAKRRKR